MEYRGCNGSLGRFYGVLLFDFIGGCVGYYRVFVDFIFGLFDFIVVSYGCCGLRLVFGCGGVCWYIGCCGFLFLV